MVRMTNLLSDFEFREKETDIEGGRCQNLMRVNRREDWVPIGWHKICCTVEEGGLGIRDIEIFNKALLLKIVWQMAENKDRLWVKVMQAKYYPRGGFWAVKNKQGCQLWRSVQGLKAFFMGQTQWDIADGNSIQAINQPWCPGWELQRVTTNQQRDTTVAMLYNSEDGNWKQELIGELMGNQALQLIQHSAQIPKAQVLLKDKLIWTPSKTGVYTSKEGYLTLKQQAAQPPQYDQATTTALKKGWEWEGLIPRVRTFLWRAIHGGLPTMDMLHSRIQNINPTCVRCNLENEFLMHLFFFCPVARVTWFASPFALRVHSLPLNFTTTLLDITQHFNDEQIVDFCNLLWNLWKVRNEEVFAGKKPQPKAIISRAKAMNIPHQAIRGLPPVPTLVQIPRGAKTMLVDASWDT